MGRMMRAWGAVLAALAAMMPAVAHGQEVKDDLVVAATVVSDYRFRGVSQSGRRPALQANIEYQSASGWKAGVWGSTLGGAKFADGEIDLYGGVAWQTGGWRYGITGTALFFPGSDGFSYAEVQGDASYSIGPIEASATVAYSPDKFSLGNDNVYFGGGLSAAVPATPFTLSVKGGYEDGFIRDKLDWQAQLGWASGPFNASVAWVDTNQRFRDRLGRGARSGVVTSAGFQF